MTNEPNCRAFRAKNEGAAEKQSQLPPALPPGRRPPGPLPTGWGPTAPNKPNPGIGSLSEQPGPGAPNEPNPGISPLSERPGPVAPNKANFPLAGLETQIWIAEQSQFAGRDRLTDAGWKWYKRPA